MFRGGLFAFRSGSVCVRRLEDPVDQTSARPALGRRISLLQFSCSNQDGLLNMHGYDAALNPRHFFAARKTGNAVTAWL